MNRDPAIERNRHNIVLTGPARSGTTLSVYLLNKARNTVALDEPMLPGKLYRFMPDKDAVCDGIEKYYRRTRRMVITERKAVSKHIGGKLTDATYGAPNAEGRRESLLEKGEISIDKEVSEDFDLMMKHPGMFTALLPQLKHRFPCYAIVRNPLSVMASRSSMGKKQDASRDGQTERSMPRDPSTWKGNAAHMFDEELKRQMAPMAGGTFEWKLKMLDWACAIYRRELAEENIIRYEDIVGSRGKALSQIVPAAEELDEPLESKNLNPLYDREMMLEVGERLLRSEGAYWHFYTRESVEELLDQIR
ncbi:MAG TPA: hypothetical protein VFI90_08175 [Rubrobacter sp.]|nr:hypothetical protein [Rubrobacter sp.]